MSIKEYNITHTQMGGGELKEDVGGGSTTLTPATASTLGGVKIGNGISVTADGTISAQGGGSDESAPLIMLVGNEGSVIDGIRVIPIEFSQIDYDNPPVIYLSNSGSLIPIKCEYTYGDETMTVLTYSSLSASMSQAINDGETKIFSSTDVFVEQNDMPGIISDFTTGFNVRIRASSLVINAPQPAAE